jgi:hypothetical protein
MTTGARAMGIREKKEKAGHSAPIKFGLQITRPLPDKNLAIYPSLGVLNKVCFTKTSCLLLI